jgi:quercetin dioxygenase-like cupin family protein
MTDCKEEVILETEDVRVRIMCLENGSATDWHYHSCVTDTMICLKGQILVETQKPVEKFKLAVAEKCQVPPKRVHRVVNTSAGVANYLLIQGLGRYDFLRPH